MMQFVVSPDYSPEHFSGWHMVNTWLQKQLNEPVHVSLPGSADEQKELLKTAAFVYANPFDAVTLVRDQHFIPIIKPLDHYDEVVLAVSQQSPINNIEDLKNHTKPLKISATSNFDMRLLGLRLLEPANINDSNHQFIDSVNFQASIRSVVKDESTVSLFMTQTYAGLSKISKSQLKVLVSSSIHDIHHLVLVHPDYSHKVEALQQAWCNLKDNDILSSIGIHSGFDKLSLDDTLFMMDIMDTLMD